MGPLKSRRRHDPRLLTGGTDTSNLPTTTLLGVSSLAQGPARSYLSTASRAVCTMLLATWPTLLCSDSQFGPRVFRKAGPGQGSVFSAAPAHSAWPGEVG